jgi:4-amino-4-deoxy-L-arabinose transferase-like glycosyltransferase
VARWIAAAVVLAHLATSRGYGYFRDELYYLACSEHPALGYVDHPPLLDLLLRPLRALLGDSLPALRLLPALAAGATVLLTACAVGRLGGGRLARVLALVAVAAGPIYVGTFAILTPNALDVVAWTVVLLLVLRLLSTDDDRLWIAVGAAIGLGFETKHGMAFLAIGLAAGLLATPARRRLRSPWLWAGVATALAVAAPHLAWQAAHGWPTLEFMANARRDKNLARGPLAFVGEQMTVLGPLAAPIWIAGLVSCWRRDGGRLRAIACAYAATLALLIAGGGKAYYLTSFYPVLFAAGAVAIERASRRRAPALGLAVLVLATDLAAAPLAKALLPEEAVVRWQAALGLDPRLGVDERNALGALPQQFADQHGWPELAADVARVYRALPDYDRARACIVASNYGEAAAIDFFGPALGLPRAVSPHNSYWLWGRRDCDFTVAIVVGYEPEQVAAMVRRVAVAGAFSCRWCMPFENRPILLTRGLTVPPDVLWAQAKRYL